MSSVAYTSGLFSHSDRETVENDANHPIMEIDRLPIGVVTGVECATVSIEFIGENEDQLASIFIRWYTVHVGRRVLVEQSKDFRVRYLSSCIGGDACPTTMGEAYDHRVTSTGDEVVENEKFDGERWNLQQRDQSNTEENKTAEVYQTPPREDLGIMLNAITVALIESMQFVVAITENVGTPGTNVRRKRELGKGLRCQGVHELVTKPDFAIDSA